jgi:hypothetical protein
VKHVSNKNVIAIKLLKGLCVGYLFINGIGQIRLNNLVRIVI